MAGHAAPAVKAPPPTLEQAHARALQATIIIQGLTPSPSVAKPGPPPAPSPLKAPPPALEQHFTPSNVQPDSVAKPAMPQDLPELVACFYNIGLPGAYTKKTDIIMASKDHYMAAVLIPLETKTPVILVPRAKLSIGTDSKHDHTSKSSTDKSAIPAPPPKANHSSIVSQPDAGDVKFLSDRKSM